MQHIATTYTLGTDTVDLVVTDTELFEDGTIVKERVYRNGRLCIDSVVFRGGDFAGFLAAEHDRRIADGWKQSYGAESAKSDDDYADDGDLLAQFTRYDSRVDFLPDEDGHVYAEFFLNGMCVGDVKVHDGENTDVFLAEETRLRERAGWTRTFPVTDAPVHFHVNVVTLDDSGTLNSVTVKVDHLTRTMLCGYLESSLTAHSVENRDDVVYVTLSGSEAMELMTAELHPATAVGTAVRCGLMPVRRMLSED